MIENRSGNGSLSPLMTEKLKKSAKPVHNLLVTNNLWDFNLSLGYDYSLVSGQTISLVRFCPLRTP